LSGAPVCVKARIPHTPNRTATAYESPMKSASLSLALCISSFVPAGDAIVACGEKFSIGAPVVLWSDPGGFDAYKVPAPTGKGNEKSKADRKRFAFRSPELDDKAKLDALREVVDQFVLHYDVCGTSKTCFKVLNDRGLSVHFMLDLDGTIYQSLDLKEKAWHATIANGRSIGVEIAHIGAYSPNAVPDRLAEWYQKDANGEVRVVIPKRFGEQKWRLAEFTPRPRKSEPVVGEIQGRKLRMYDFTPQQYDSLIKLTAGLTKVFPKIRCDYPRDASGKLIPHKLPDDQLQRYAGVLGHFHVQANKTDPGPALDWEHVIGEAGKLRQNEVR
jgi:N-acetylmuramoyl-L-alanine amidase